MPEAKTKSTSLKPVLIRSWPKMIFLWPSAVLALFMGIANHYASPDYAHIWGGTFLVVLGINMMVLTFEFPRATSLTLAITGVAVVLLLLLLNHRFNVIAPLRTFVTSSDIEASTEFYIYFFVINLLLYLAMFIVTRFDYWELSANELVHHHGLLGDIDRYSTVGLKLSKEITDIFEYLLCGAGTIVIQIPAVPRPIILSNVLNIGTIEKLSDRMLDARVVRIEQVPVADTGGAPVQDPEAG